MKKIIVGILIGLMCLSICACADTASTLDAGPYLGTITLDNTKETITEMDGSNVVITVANWSQVDYCSVFGTATRIMRGHNEDGSYYYWRWNDVFCAHFFHHGLEPGNIDGDGDRDISFDDESDFDYYDRHEEVEWTSEYDEGSDTMKIIIWVGCEYTVDFDVEVEYN